MYMYLQYGRRSRITYRYIGMRAYRHSHMTSREYLQSILANK